MGGRSRPNAAGVFRHTLTRGGGIAPPARSWTRVWAMIQSPGLRDAGRPREDRAGPAGSGGREGTMLPSSRRGWITVAGGIALLVALGAGDSPAANRGIPLKLGDSSSSEIGPGVDDADDFVVDLAAGTLLTATVTAPKASGLLPYVPLFEPARVLAA